MLDGRRLGEEVCVGLAGKNEVPVGDVGQRGEHITTECLQLTGVGHEDAEQHRDARQGRERRRHEPPEAAGPEVAEIDGAPPLVLGDEQRGDQESREGEEGGNAEEPAPGPFELTMEEEDPDHGEPP